MNINAALHIVPQEHATANTLMALQIQNHPSISGKPLMQCRTIMELQGTELLLVAKKICCFPDMKCYSGSPIHKHHKQKRCAFRNLCEPGQDFPPGFYLSY